MIELSQSRQAGDIFSAPQPTPAFARWPERTIPAHAERTRTAFPLKSEEKLQTSV
jgi:hypothetical protein